MIDVKILADSYANEARMTTFQVRMHRFMIPELTRHRMLSFSIASNRAIPTWKVVTQVQKDPAKPVYWGKNQRGMQAIEEVDNVSAVESTFDLALKDAVEWSKDLVEYGAHKQVVNRLLEPFQWTDVIVSGTDWQGFFDLRCHPDAQPEIRVVAELMRDTMDSNEPKELKPGEWHLPYISYGDMQHYDLETLQKCSMARCARVSYQNHDKSDPDVEKDVDLANRLIESNHWSPAEHQASPMPVYNGYRTGLWSLKEAMHEPGYTHVDKNLSLRSGNLKHFFQLRHLLEVE